MKHETLLRPTGALMFHVACSMFHASSFKLVRAAGGANGGEGVGFFAVGALVPERAAQDLFAAATTAAHDNLIFLNFAAILA